MTIAGEKIVFALAAIGTVFLAVTSAIGILTVLRWGLGL